MQRVAGLAFLGFVTEHVLPFLHGLGANGKTVFANVLQGLLGEADLGGYAVSAPDGFLMAGRDNVHPTRSHDYAVHASPSAPNRHQERSSTRRRSNGSPAATS